MKKIYVTPITEEMEIGVERSLLIQFSQVDNDGDGTTDQRPIHEGDPEDGVGAKPLSSGHCLTNHKASFALQKMPFFIVGSKRIRSKK